MGISGWAEVGAIGNGPDPGPRPSPRHSLVTATFKHTSDQVVRLQVSGEAQPLGVTASHPIWSVDRGAFVEVGELDQGERVLGLDGGEHLVAAVLPRPGPTAVYNLEVYGAHVCHVGTSGLLAHNMCAAERAGKGISAARLGTSPAPIAGKLSAEASDVLRTEARDIWYATTGRRAIWDGLQIHHRIPLEWSHLFPRADPNRLSNLVGVDRATHTLINDTWVAWKRGLHGRAPTQSEIMKQVLHTDKLFGGSWVFPK